ncbi:MAG: hypothetical protein H8E16_10125 [Flavobacteriales bacterium]|nr:hypothetical protein [Flavobacteriales bacterium]
MGIFDFLKKNKNISEIDLDGGTGRSERYYDNGKGPLMCHRYLIGFKLHGKEQFFYRNGQIKSDWNWKDNKRDGTWKSYEENGQLVYEEHYKDGEKIFEKRWDENGKEIE